MQLLSFRRYYLDNLLSHTVFSGKVLDLGGKKQNKRGLFRPPLDVVSSWEYLNIDASTNPDYLCSAENIPVEDQFFDMILMAEVLEHVSNPTKILNECYRVLKVNGKLVVTMPLLYPIHADPFDFQRWTHKKIELEFHQAGFNVEVLKPMGGVVGVVYDIIDTYLYGKTSLLSKILKKIMRLMIRPLVKMDSIADKQDKITTGYYVVATKIPII